MEHNSQEKLEKQQDLQKTAQRPNEMGTLNIDEFLRISDPETRQVFVETRA